MKTEHIMVSMSCVFRDSFLFSDTLYNNIGIGKPGATKGEVYTAAKGTLRVPDTFNFPCMPTHLLFEYGKIGNESKDITIPHGAFGY